MSGSFKEFIYLDRHRIDSIIAQLNSGMVESIISQKSKKVTGNSEVSSSITEILLKWKLGLSGELAKNTTENKIFHDYSFEVAKKSLKNLVELDTENDKICMNQVEVGTFVIVSGYSNILDYSELRSLAANGDKIESLFQTGSTKRRNRVKDSVFTQLATFMENVMPDLIVYKMQFVDETGMERSFIGNLKREYLRENMSDILFKYGNYLDYDWKMFCQISRIPSKDALDNAKRIIDERNKHKLSPFSKMSSVNTIIDELVEVTNSFKELVATVCYPNVAVTPIAIYREF
ncbi:hypothetical protein JEG43_02650 [Anoxybacillus sp. LAT_35]|uniref:DUF6414 family protein n=1 Tax=Anoxybacillus TaxID=150247 RepID=UPI001EDAF664|nr:MULTISPECIES: hypothetical protein [unclassified Anoxybacillus]MCG5025171.1 hypothetical protein [Anoxybacillus flavithermus]MCG3084987.1 hypothetical protein [Anoxybacillus sp. LAT27]MCG6171737.1 hypothetical protein [Anoxybacillus sp. LAT_11]MCG6175010.1 hypothetical protein [Anoxybacillus sp. LAT_31]MCG6176956.1 hypothetical protein [Anoxybacillus sp. LAT_35]